MDDNKYSNWTKNNKNYASWIFSNSWKNKNNPAPDFMTNDEMIAKILASTEERSFLDDILEWLNDMAPRKIGSLLRHLCVGLLRSHYSLTYKDFCRAVYEMGFRASEVIERRMILSSSNEWVRKYFEDFPPRK